MYVHTLPKYVYVCIRLSHLLSLSLQFNGACLHAIDAAAKLSFSAVPSEFSSEQLLSWLHSANTRSA
jgi:hypothetical protein